jgi:hypothetical protein
MDRVGGNGRVFWRLHRVGVYGTVQGGVVMKRCILCGGRLNYLNSEKVCFRHKDHPEYYKYKKDKPARNGICASSSITNDWYAEASWDNTIKIREAL